MTLRVYKAELFCKYKSCTLTGKRWLVSNTLGLLGINACVRNNWRGIIFAIHACFSWIGRSLLMDKIIYTSLCLSLSLSVFRCLSLCLPLCLSLYLSMYISLSLSICFSLSLSVSLYISYMYIYINTKAFSFCLSLLWEWNLRFATATWYFSHLVSW